MAGGRERLVRKDGGKVAGWCQRRTVIHNCPVEKHEASLSGKVTGYARLGSHWMRVPKSVRNLSKYKWCLIQFCKSK